MDGEIKYKIVQILNSRLDCKRRSPLIYYVQWTGYEGMADKYFWLSTLELTNIAELVQEFHT